MRDVQSRSYNFNLAGSGTDGLGVVELWVSGGSVAETTGVAEGPVGGDGLGGRDDRNTEESVTCG